MGRWFGNVTGKGKDEGNTTSVSVPLVSSLGCVRQRADRRYSRLMVCTGILLWRPEDHDFLSLGGGVSFRRTGGLPENQAARPTARDDTLRGAEVRPSRRSPTPALAHREAGAGLRCTSPGWSRHGHAA